MNSTRKILSVIIPAYNMEKYVGSALDSLAEAGKCFEKLDVIVVNDGSRDNTSQIAHRYEKKYPEVIRVVDKENGNYGSAVNAGLAIARGEYVKILDSDDRYDGAALEQFVSYIESHRDADMIVSSFKEIRNNKEYKVSYDIYGRSLFEQGNIYSADEVFSSGKLRFFMMHSVTYRTRVLLENHYHQTEGISYTDQEWVFYPLMWVDTISFTDIPVYLYNTSREGQTMSASVQLRSLSQLELLTSNMAEGFHEYFLSKPDSKRLSQLREIIRGRVRVILRKYLLEMSSSEFAQSDFPSIWNKLLILSQKCAISIDDIYPSSVIKISLSQPWQSSQRRLSTPVRKIILFAEKVMNIIYEFMFR